MVKASPAKKASPKAGKPIAKGAIVKAKEKSSPPVELGVVTEDGSVEFFGKKFKLAEKEKLERLFGGIKRRATMKDLHLIVNKVDAFEKEGILVLPRYKRFKCCICQKIGHPREVCPKSFKDGKWQKLCFVCGEAGFPHKACQEKVICLLCKKEGHRCKECPEYLATLKDKENKAKSAKPAKKEAVKEEEKEEEMEDDDDEEEEMDEDEDEENEEEEESEEDDEDEDDEEEEEEEEVVEKKGKSVATPKNKGGKNQAKQNDNKTPLKAVPTPNKKGGKTPQKNEAKKTPQKTPQKNEAKKTPQKTPQKNGMKDNKKRALDEENKKPNATPKSAKKNKSKA